MRIADPSLGGYISVFVGPPLFLLVAFGMGDLHSIASFTWKGYLWLSVAGIIHFVLGRSSNYLSVKYLGANMASVFSALSLLYTVLLGILVLGERMTQNIVLGSLLIIVGPALLAWPQSKSGARTDKPGSSHLPRLSAKGVLAALLMGLFFGITPLFIKLGLKEGGSALAGAFVSYTSASLILGATMANGERRNGVVFMDRQAMLWFVFSGLLVSMAQLLRYTALRIIPISVAGPLIATSPVFMLALSFAINRRVETFRPNVIVGAVLVVLGTALVYR